MPHYASVRPARPRPDTGQGRVLQGAAPCRECSLFRLCRAPAPVAAGRAGATPIVRCNRSLPACSLLYREGDPVSNVYVVRSGAIKVSEVTPDGNERIVDFALAGDPVGFDALARQRQNCQAVALSAIVYCEISVQRLMAACRGAPRLQTDVLRIMGTALGDSLRRRFLWHREASARVAGLLLDLSDRFARHGLRADEFRLPMLRRDIAEYLGLSLETVSRTLQDLQRRGLIAVRARLVRLIATDGLLALTYGGAAPAPAAR